MLIDALELLLIECLRHGKQSRIMRWAIEPARMNTVRAGFKTQSKAQMSRKQVYLVIL